MYAGWSGNDGVGQSAYDEVWVLALPAFRWFKAEYSARYPRYGHTCHIVGNRQMLTIGGLNASGTDPVDAWFSPDSFTQGIGVFDMTDMRWASSYDATAAPYAQPEVVRAWYNKKYVPTLQMIKTTSMLISTK